MPIMSVGKEKSLNGVYLLLMVVRREPLVNSIAPYFTR